MKFIFDEILNKLTERLDVHIDALSHGTPESFEQYAEMVGTITGIRLSIQEVGDVQEMVTKQEDE